MIVLFTEKEFEEAPSRKKVLKLQCKQCSKIFLATRHKIQAALNENHHHTCDFCSRACSSAATSRLTIAPCGNCGKKVTRKKNQGRRSKSGKIFCDLSCACSYNNKNKKHGTRRSKMEIYLEEMITETYPDLEVVCNGKTTIGSELDFYFPSLALAIEVNGIYHYKPIHGKDKLKKIRRNDKNKSARCVEKSIDLKIINSSKCKRFGEKEKVAYWKKFESILKNSLRRL